MLFGKRSPFADGCFERLTGRERYRQLATIVNQDDVTRGLRRQDDCVVEGNAALHQERQYRRKTGERERHA